MAVAGRTIWWGLSGISGGLSVAAGVYGAHVLPSKQKELQLPDECFQKKLQNWDTAQRYHMFHSAVLLSIPFIAPPLRGVIGSLFLSGIGLFSGSLYTKVLTGSAPFDNSAPIGGSLLLCAWFLLPFAKIRI